MEASIHPEAIVHLSSYISPLAVIGKAVIIEKDVYISRGAKIYGRALIKEGTYIGEECIIGHLQRAQLAELMKSKQDVFNFEGPLVTIGTNCIIRSGSIVYNEVVVGDNCQTGHNVMIREKTLIGKNTLIGTSSVIDGNVSIGEHVSIQTGVYIPLFCRIGNHVFMGPYCKLTNDKYMTRKSYDLNGVIVEDFVSLGANSVTLPGIILKKGSIIGAGSVVTHDTNERDIVIGNPARFLKKVPMDWQISD
ncbi:MAG: DapH/DapD/GlmU-related protein [Candidatus Thorarchaeota archaeon]